MTRQHTAFLCGEDTLVGTLDDGPNDAGLLIISGGNEIRSGAFSGQANIAAKVAQVGFPVFRFDRRGVGDSSGENGGFRGSAKDISAALTAFRQYCPAVKAIIGFGNCDAASALMLARGDGCGALILANPWTFDDNDDEGGGASDTQMPAAAIRARYANRLRNPREWLRLLRGGVDLRKLASGFRAAAQPNTQTSSLTQEMQQGLAQFGGPVKILLADRDRTAQAFVAAWPDDSRIAHRKNADHAFSDPADAEWLLSQLLAALNEQAG